MDTRDQVGFVHKATSSEHGDSFSALLAMQFASLVDKQQVFFFFF